MRNSSYLTLSPNICILRGLLLAVFLSNLFPEKSGTTSTLPVAAAAASPICLGSCETGDDGITKVCRFDFKVNLHAGELGYFQVEQCGEDPNPTLGIEKGVTYIFSQKVSGE